MTKPRGLRLAPDLTLPEDFATQGVVVLGVRGSGKSNTEVRWAEKLHAAQIPFVAIDPKGDWYGVRMEGTGPGLPIPVFGGAYADFPLDESLGDRIADLLVDENLSAVLDVSRLSKASGLPKFLTAFCNRLMARHADEPHVRNVILEEAHRYIPQVVRGDIARMKEAAAAVLLEGRAFGLGCWAATQRPARLHNDVLEEVDTAIIHRIGVTATADLGRVRKWVEHEELSPEIAVSLTKLRNGEAWVLSPVALGIVQRVQIDRRTTYDSGAAPLVGAAARRAAGSMATIDAPAITQALQDAIKKAEADDPKRLHAEVARLTRELAAAQAARAAAESATTEPEPVPYVPPEVPAALKASLESIDHVLAELAVLGDAIRAAITEAEGAITAGREAAQERLRAALAVAEATPGPIVPRPAGLPSAGLPSRPTTAPTPPRAAPTRPRATTPAPTPPSTDDGEYAPKAGAVRMLEALARFPAGLSRRRLATFSRMTATGGAFASHLGGLVRNGYVTDDGGTLRITERGMDAVGGTPLPSDPAALRAEWRSRLGGGGTLRMFDALCDAYPDEAPLDWLAEMVGLSRTGGAWGAAIKTLRDNDLAEFTRDTARANPDLFVEGP